MFVHFGGRDVPTIIRHLTEEMAPQVVTLMIYSAESKL